jgi:hypothetical protein
MALPGFAAEASLYRSDLVYRGRSRGTSEAPGVVTARASQVGVGISIGDIIDFGECWWDCVVVIGGRWGTCAEVCADIFL